MWKSPAGGRGRNRRRTRPGNADGVDGHHDPFGHSARQPHVVTAGILRPRACSSNWQSSGLLIRSVWVRVPPGPLPSSFLLPCEARDSKAYRAFQPSCRAVPYPAIAATTGCSRVARSSLLRHETRFYGQPRRSSADLRRMCPAKWWELGPRAPMGVDHPASCDGGLLLRQRRSE